VRIQVFAVGRMKSGPERDLAARYFDRVAKVAPPLGLEFGGVTEAAESRARDADQRKREEAAKLSETIGQGTALILLDERGKSLSSPDFASMIVKHRDSGARVMTFAIGGADGHAEESRQKAQMVISFGAMTFPHQIMRILIAEQLYRAATIISGHPYHRE
jgi:23S rRNA (pseudouridine1915-N3)-methyltransferase